MNLLRRVNLFSLPSKGKSSKGLKVIESEEESPDGDLDEDPTVKITRLSNRLQYLAKKNKKLLSKRSSYKGSRKEDQKGCFNCKKPGRFIADCPDLQKEKSKEKSKKPTFKSSKFKKQIKQSESESDKDDADEDAKVAMGLVATVTSEAEPGSDSEEENEV